jgi:hypothetical protein
MHEKPEIFAIGTRSPVYLQNGNDRLFPSLLAQGFPLGVLHSQTVFKFSRHWSKSIGLSRSPWDRPGVFLTGQFPPSESGADEPNDKPPHH